MRRIRDALLCICRYGRGKPTALGYATSQNLLSGHFTYRGIIIDNAACDPSSWNNHGSIECVNGQWYVFHHQCSGGTAEPELCIEKLRSCRMARFLSKDDFRGIGKPYQKNGWKAGGRVKVYGGAFIG